ncbi:OmpA family protein [Streptomyces sp. R08]|uniref:OmpA family protein n=1 Tax=Streptomyces sp. R08 TaxID=3238624 RepID=A0AB39MIB6_9ACTN
MCPWALGTGPDILQRAAASPYGPRAGLALREGAALAPPRVLRLESESAGVSQVVGEEDGAERRRDTNTDVTYVLRAEILFAKDSARLSGPARSRVAAIAREIGRRRAVPVIVSGFTDDLGSSVHGDDLSTRRAQAVRSALADGLPPSVSFETRGFGERYPVASNRTEAGRRENRRVEISFPQEGS